MTTIRPADEFGPVLTGRGQAAVLRAHVEQLAQHEHVVIDFEDVLTASPSFADEFFAKLDPDLLDREDVVIENLPASIAAIVRYVRSGRAGAFSD